MGVWWCSQRLSTRASAWLTTINKDSRVENGWWLGVTLHGECPTPWNGELIRDLMTALVISHTYSIKREKANSKLMPFLERQRDHREATMMNLEFCEWWKTRKIYQFFMNFKTYTSTMLLIQGQQEQINPQHGDMFGAEYWLFCNFMQ